MTPIAKKFLVASLAYFILGLVVQTVVGFDVWLGFNPLAYTTMTAVGQILFVGWLTQAALALVYEQWLSTVETDAKAGMLVFVLFNLGLPLLIVARPGLVLLGGNWLGVMAALGALLQLLAGLIFLRTVWVFFKEKP